VGTGGRRTDHAHGGVAALRYSVADGLRMHLGHHCIVALPQRAVFDDVRPEVLHPVDDDRVQSVHRRLRERGAVLPGVERGREVELMATLFRGSVMDQASQLDYKAFRPQSGSSAESGA